MGFRETLQNNPGRSKIAACALILLAATLIGYELRGNRVSESILAATSKGFYSDDDGKTWFIDDAIKGSPIDHHGREAYRAIVCRCPGGRPFVAFLAKYSDEQQAQIKKDAAANPGQPSEAQFGPLRSIKKPGETGWAPNSSPSITGYPSVPCPNGAGTAIPVSPADPDSDATN